MIIITVTKLTATRTLLVFLSSFQLFTCHSLVSLIVTYTVIIPYLAIVTSTIFEMMSVESIAATF